MTDALMPASAETPSNKQRLFLRYYTGFLMDLVVLNLFAEYSIESRRRYVHDVVVGCPGVAGAVEGDDHFRAQGAGLV